MNIFIISVCLFVCPIITQKPLDLPQILIVALRKTTGQGPKVPEL